MRLERRGSSETYEHGEVVLALDVVGVNNVHASDQATKSLKGKHTTSALRKKDARKLKAYRDTVSLSDTENGRVNVGGTGFEGAESVRDG